MHRHLSLLFAAALATAWAGAQTATYTTFGAGCPGSGSGGYCLSANPQGGTLTITQNTNIFALELKTTGTTVVLGFQLFTRALSSPITITTELLPADTAGKPGGPALRTGTMMVGTQDGWYTTTFSPLLVQPNTTLFLSYGSQSGLMMFPIVSAGTKVVHYYHAPTSSVWNGPFTTQNWAWRVLCPGAAVPVLGNTGLPSLGKTLTVTLDKARATAAAGLITGGSKTAWGPFTLPLDLTAAGAKGCNLLVSFDLLGAVVTDANGQASVPIPVPNASQLLGVVFHQQWLINDTANTLGWVFTNGGTGTVGN